MEAAERTLQLQVSRHCFVYLPPHGSEIVTKMPILVLTILVGVDTAQTLEGILAQVEQNKKDLPAAIAANVAAGVAGGNEGASAISGA
jgi:hypothetical protein